MLQGRKIILGVTGSIAAYKSATLTRLLVKAGAQVQVIMTPGATEFITPLTLSTLSNKPVHTSMSNPQTGVWTNHVDLGLWADALVIAPASADTMARMAAGICDNLLLTTWLSARCPVFLAPAMDADMYAHQSTQANLQKLRSFGHHVLNPGHGLLASGLTGTGRMAEPEEIFSALETFFDQNRALKGKYALVTAGPTLEAIDPVRFISNHSTGKMGFAIADALATAGATVSLITGPTQEVSVRPGISITSVTSAEEMYNACIGLFTNADITVLTAAVSDFRPVQMQERKMKKSGSNLILELTNTVDIAHELGKQKTNSQLIVGFALETDHEIENAREKLRRKNMDMVVLNSLRDPGAGFGHDTNKVTILDRNGSVTSLPLLPKSKVAENIIRHIITFIHE